MAETKKIQTEEGATASATPAAIVEPESKPPTTEPVKLPSPAANEHAKVVSRSSRAGLLMPVGRVKSQLKRTKLVGRVSDGAAVFMAGAQEEIARAVYEKAIVVAKREKVARITPKHIVKATKEFPELQQLMRGGIVANVEVEPENEVKKEVVTKAAQKSRLAAAREKKRGSREASLKAKSEKLAETKKLAAAQKRRQKRLEEKKKKKKSEGEKTVKKTKKKSDKKADEDEDDDESEDDEEDDDDDEDEEEEEDEEVVEPPPAKKAKAADDAARKKAKKQQPAAKPKQKAKKSE